MLWPGEEPAVSTTHIPTRNEPHGHRKHRAQDRHPNKRLKHSHLHIARALQEGLLEQWRTAQGVCGCQAQVAEAHRKCMQQYAS